jgi:ferredoxin
MAQVQVLRSDPTLMKRLKKFGAFEVDACFDCGNCTAVCPLSNGRTAFPRKMITYAQQGLEGKLLATPDMWLCDYCGECTKTCPRQAEPSEFMMATRRFAISKYTPTPVARLIFTSNLFVLIFMAAAALVPIELLATLTMAAGQATNMFAFIPEIWIHYSGIAVGVAIGLAVLTGVIRMYRRVTTGMAADGQGVHPGLRVWLRELVPTVFKDSLVQSRSAECTTDPVEERLKGRWFNHMMILWGFLGLLASTALRFLVVPTNGVAVPLTDPVRLLGTVSGALLVYGALAMMVSRVRKQEVSTRRTQFTDWVFLALLLLAGLTGFLLEAFDYSSAQWLLNIGLATHLVVVFELLILAPFTKFSHAVYRPFAVWISRAYGRI